MHFSEDLIKKTNDALAADLGKRKGDWWLRTVMWFAGFKSCLAALDDSEMLQSINQMASSDIVQDLVQKYPERHPAHVGIAFTMDCDQMTNDLLEQLEVAKII